jgi:flavodoxin
MEKLAEMIYFTEDNTLKDSLWVPENLEERREVDSESDMFFDAESELTEDETSNLVSHLMANRWWNLNDIYSEEELHTAYQAVVDGIPTDFNEAMKSDEKKFWKEAMDAEMKNIRENNTYNIKRIKYGEKVTGCRWVFKKKLNKDGTVNKYKARLVAKGYLQVRGRDFNETFAPVAKFKSIRLLLAIAAQRSWKVYHDDVTSAFLNGALKETVLMDQPDGYAQGLKNDKWELRKTLYGLKQSPREWNEVIHKFLLSEIFFQSKLNPCLYHKKNENYELLAGIYVDDVISTGSDDKEVPKFRNLLKNRFKCSEGGLLRNGSNSK